MRSFCRGIVRSLGAFWRVLAWTLFIAALVLPHLPFSGSLFWPLLIGVRIALGLWWLIDLVDQDYIDSFLGGSILLVFVTLVIPPDHLLFIVTWLVYWTSMRRKN